MKLNKVEVWIAEHSIRIFAVVALLTLIGVGLFVYLFDKYGDEKKRVDVLERKVTRIVKVREGTAPKGPGPEGGGAQNPSNAGQQPSPGKGHQGGKKPPKSPPPAPAPSPSPAPATPESAPSPGNSGKTPGAEKGVKACVNLAVSACAEVGLGN